MKIYSPQLKGTTTLASGSTASITGSFTGSIAGIDINLTNEFTASTKNRLTTIENVTGSYETKGSGIVSGSSQITISSTTGYTDFSGSVATSISASVAGATWANINGKPAGIVSGSSQVIEIISPLNTYTSSVKNAINVIGEGTSSVTTIYGNLVVEGTTITVSASNLAIADNMIYLNDGNTITDPDLGIAGNYNDGVYQHAGIFSDASDSHTWKVYKGYTPEPSQSIDITHGSFTLADFQAATLKGSISATNGVVSGSSQITYANISSIPVGIVSGSSQITYANISSIPVGIVSGSSQVIGILSSLNSKTGSYATTGSNTFFANQIVSGNVLITGSVGIGITNPGALLAVHGRPNTDGFGFFMGGAGSTLGGIKVGNDVTTYGSLYFDNGTNDVVLLQQYPIGNLRLGTNSGEKMRITNSGNVIIGNTTAYGGLTVSDFTANDGNDTISLFYRGTAGGHQSLMKFYDFRGQLNASMGNELEDDTPGTPRARIVFKTSNGDSPIERMRINASGIITTPSQVSFKAYISNNINPTKSTNLTVPYNIEEYDTQGNYSTSTYKFTAPVAGKYLFTVNFNAYGLDDTAYLRIMLLINSANVRTLFLFPNMPTGNTGDVNVSGTDILSLSTGNTVEVRVYTDGSGTYGMSQALDWNSFSGHLLG